MRVPESHLPPASLAIPSLKDRETPRPSQKPHWQQRAGVRAPRGMWRVDPGVRRAGCWAQSPCSATKGEGAAGLCTPALSATVGFGAKSGQ